MASAKSEPYTTDETLEDRREVLRRITDQRVAPQMAAMSSPHERVSNLKIDYYIPKTAVFQGFAQEVGAQLAEISGDSGYSEQAVIDGLATFLKVVCELLAARLNKGTKQQKA